MTCPSCSASNRPGVAFCSGCGERLPVRGAADRKGLAMAALLLGIASVPLIYVFELSFLVGLAAGACGAGALAQTKRHPLEFGGRRLALAGGGIGALVALLSPVWASIVIPARAQARITSNEEAALLDLRAVVAAEKLYALANHDYYDTLGCLAQPQECTPGRVADGVTILEPHLVTTNVRNGYAFTLFLGGKPAAAAAGISPSSATRFAYVAVPVKPGLTGDRVFCGDDTAIRAGSSDSALRAREVRCPESWPVVT